MASVGGRKVPSALTIAGSDSGGGAGIQADLKTFAALGVYGTSALTAITAQNTVAVTAVHEIPADIIAAQIQAVISDIGADAVKTGMLSSIAIVEVVAQELRRHRVERLVVDPVMVAKSGDSLLREEAVEALRTQLLPLALVVTPNIPEAEVLTGMTIASHQDMRRAAEQIVGMGARGVVVKGGHLDGPATDLFYDGSRFQEFTAPRIDTVNTHGTGCTFASAVAAGLAQNMSVIDAVAQAKEYVTEAIRCSFPIGQGHGPLNHFYKLWD
ncbi:MAG: bifunctional hydroxymethylpyrimidine kinase/phosphomethylpyrimidine kinase [Chloroflexi bacterium]|nr:bifunctional hydroxymethylpyrimidine kinase/phosphomethylpyrimidine kinase [Chloroflexota bacterium]MDA1218032.1 bifunctional hydroxymethylpyrimidine kinase/phosphomethylpyrimidine kinase [Chloroflexota bacterium]PKB57303.1 MAG: bifunctional hydroxymethylpyrimidine kinase/phosphomethylpyrimidine kinase [SAR202 cluster bacterium Casp-Chloro-G3]